MARKRRQPTETPAPETPAAGHNSGEVNAERVQRFEREFTALQAQIKGLTDKRTALCKAASSDGIDVPVAKAIFRLKKLTAPEAGAKHVTYTRYTQQLGLLDWIEQYRGEVEREDNAASVEAAERENAKHAPRGEPESGGAKEAAYAQGYEAGQGAATRNSNPYREGEREEAWFDGFDAGRLAKVDAENSELAGAAA